MSVVSPITTPVPWSMNRPLPIFAAGWISIPVSVRVISEIRRARRVERVRDPVRQQRVDPRPRRDQLELPHVARRRIAHACRLQVATKLFREERKCAETEHANSVAANPWPTYRVRDAASDAARWASAC
jgi:hypothetical protein